MKTLFLECSMGAAGDMLTAALVDLLPDKNAFIAKLREVLPHGVSVSAERTEKKGIQGMQMTVRIHGEEEHSHDAASENSHSHEHAHTDALHEQHAHHHHEHHHTSVRTITDLIENTNVSDAVKSRFKQIYGLIAEAEGYVHQKPVDEIHFHEVGNLDAFADILAVCLLMEEIAPDHVIVSPVCTGFGHVHCAHGILPVPAPATAYLLRNVPIYSGTVEGELCTPTGAALLTAFADEFSAMPVMRSQAIGYGFGKKDYSRLNCVRAFLGETEGQTEQIAELCCNLDDMTGEAIGFAQEKLLDAGALDVFTTPITMKKSRPAILLTVLCRPEQRAELVNLLFRYTTTAGIRERSCSRYTLQRKEQTVQTCFGNIRVKQVEGYGVKRSKPEYEDLKRISETNGISIDSARSAVEAELS